jgi:hypothetical protein
LARPFEFLASEYAESTCAGYFTHPFKFLTSEYAEIDHSRQDATENRIRITKEMRPWVSFSNPKNSA